MRYQHGFSGAGTDEHQWGRDRPQPGVAGSNPAPGTLRTFRGI